MHPEVPSGAALPALDEIVPLVVERCRAAAAPIEFETFLVGVRAGLSPLPEHELEEWKRAVRHAVGMVLGTEWEPLGRRVDFKRPELLLVYDLDAGRVIRTIRPVFLYGRYRKLARGLPQTRALWKCPACRGKGCEGCDDTGRSHPVSVEELIGAPAAAAFDAPADDRHYQLHGMGREDIDVRCLGGGRPFALEVRAPRRRRADLEALAREIERAAAGRVELPVGLRPVGPELPARLKGWPADKVYRAVCEAEGELDPAAVAALEARLSGVTLAQRTPARVARRRGDLVRERGVRAFRPGPPDDRRFEAVIEAESGTYIKELISGDDGRTQPSVAALLGVPCVCAELDVLEIRAEDAALLAAPERAPRR